MDGFLLKCCYHLVKMREFGGIINLSSEDRESPTGMAGLFPHSRSEEQCMRTTRPTTKQPAKMTKNRKVLIVLAAVCLPILLFTMWFRMHYHMFFGSAQPAFTVPGLSDRFVPQGIEACGDGAFLLSGYIANTGSARIYYVGADGLSRAVRVCDEEGTTLVSHAGGICTNGPYTYLASGNGKCYVLSSADLFDPASKESNILGTIETDNAASFCYLEGGHLFVGEYEYGRFETAASHHIMTPSGDGNTAVILSYELDGNQPYGVCQTADTAYSIPGRIQGMSFTDDGRVVLSASSFKDSSQLFFYDYALATGGAQGIFWSGNTPIPLYYLDSACCTNIVPMPPYSEETVFSDDWLFVLFESASSRFQFGKLIGGQYVYRMAVPAWAPKS